MYAIKLLIAWLAWFAGLFIIPLLCLVTPQGAKKWRFLDSIYGNRVDGLDGDPLWPARYFRRYRWTALRNPVNNLLRRFGPGGYVQQVARWQTWQGTICADVTMDDGSLYWLRARKTGKVWLVAGYALWDDWRLNSRLKEGHWFENRMLVWPLKRSMPVVGDG